MNTLRAIRYQAGPVKGGYTDRILRLDLGSQDLTIENVRPDFKERFIGGRGYALKMIWDETTAETRYDSPENILVMAGGPLCGEPWFPGTGKFIIGTISPLTATFIDSNVGGHFAPLLKLCGFDALAIRGISTQDVVITVDADEGLISIAEAPSFGKETDSGAIAYGTALLKDFNGGRLSESVAAVTAGIGAIHTRFGIVNSLFYDRRRGRIRSKQAGRGGTGSVMRYKGIRAIVVHSSRPRARANQPVDGEDVRRAGADLKRVLSEQDPKQLRLGDWGTSVLAEYMNQFHILPINNYQFGSHPDTPSVYADVFKNLYFRKGLPDGCYVGCNLACAKAADDVTLTRGPEAGKKVEIDGPEYETLAAVTSQGIFDPQFIMDYNYYCDQYGLDTISMGVSASFLMECFQRGYLTAEDIGYELTWGDVDSADRLLHETAGGAGIGKICGVGVRRARHWVAERYAARSGEPVKQVIDELGKFAMETKGLEFSMYVCKESLAQQGGYGFSLKGPQHDEAWLIFIDQVHNEIPTFEMKAKALKWFPLIRTWFNAVGLCKLPWIDVRHPEAAGTDNPSQNQPTLNGYVRFFNSTTGSNKALQDILNDSERLHLLQKMINLRQGKGTRAFDQIPLRAMGPAFLNEYLARQEYYDQSLRERLGSGVDLPESHEARHRALVELRREAYERLCDAVYREKGYSPNAVPLRETLERLELLDEKALALLGVYGEDEELEELNIRR